MRTPQEELEILRVSLARVAQVVGVETDDKPVLQKASFNELCEMAREPRGWNNLAGLLCGEIEYLKRDLEYYKGLCLEP